MSQVYLGNLPVTGVGGSMFHFGGGGGRETETDVTTQQINSEGTASGGEQYIHNTIMAEWEKDW